MSGPRIVVIHHAAAADLGRFAVLYPADRRESGVVLWNERDNPTFDEDVARLAAITGYPVTDEHL